MRVDRRHAQRGRHVPPRPASIASVARQYLWLTDAYFVGLSPYVQALCAAARDGVDVRLLVPGASDIPALQPLSRAGYRPLLEAGVRVFEWNGTMLHAKTAVADGAVGARRLDQPQLRELDSQLRARRRDRGRRLRRSRWRTMYEDGPRARHRDRADAAQPRAHGRRRPAPGDGARRAASGSAGRAAAGALSRRQRARRGARPIAGCSGRRKSGLLVKLLRLALAVAVLRRSVWPRLLAIPLAVSRRGSAVAMLGKAWALRRQRPGPAREAPTARARHSGAAGDAENVRSGIIQAMRP